MLLLVLFLRRVYGSKNQVLQQPNAGVPEEYITEFEEAVIFITCSLRHNGQAEHHVVVLVRQVVAVCNVVTRERPEAPEDLNGLAGIQRYHVFLAGIIRVRVGAAGAREHRMLFLVHVHRVHPTAASIGDRPEFARAAPLRQSQRGSGVEFQTVDDPLRLAARGTAALQRERPLRQ